VVADFPLPFWTMVACFFCSFFRFGRNFHLKISSLEEWRVIVLSVGSFLAGFFTFFFDFES
jgi:hypothetical protein